jgi:hypothetical protein
MDTREELSVWHALYQLEARYWHEVDCNGGRRAHEFYAPDGVMSVGHNRFEGRDRIREFYAWRERQALTAISSVKTTRHLINNLFVESSDGSRAKVLGIVSFYGAAVRPPAPQTKPPMLIADLIRMHAGRGRGLAIQVTHVAAGVHESRGAAVNCG